MTQYPFDERIRKYGYEDVIFGKTLCREHIAIDHIHNPVTIDEYESNVQFVDQKPPKGCRPYVISEMK